VVLLFAPYDLAGTNILEQRSQAALARSFRSEVARASSNALAPPAANKHISEAHSHRAKSGAAPQLNSATKAGRALLKPALVPPPGGALDHMLIPAIGVNRYVVQGVNETDLQMGPGHYPGTPLPGQPGNVGIAEHRTTFGAPFSRLNELGKRDLIYLTDTTGTTWVYSVARQ